MNIAWSEIQKCMKMPLHLHENYALVIQNTTPNLTKNVKAISKKVSRMQTQKLLLNFEESLMILIKHY